MSRFITFEGVDGAGKSTHLEWFARQLRQRQLDVIVTREPGGTPVGEKLRDILLSQPMDVGTEVLLMFASRLEHVERVIRPALSAGKCVVSDRFSDASFAYQGGGRGFPWEKLTLLEQWVHANLQPDLTLIFDLPVRIARQRLSSNASLDRFEREQDDFFEHVRQAYLKRVRQAPERYRIIDAARPIDEIRKELEVIVASI